MGARILSRSAAGLLLVACGAGPERFEERSDKGAPARGGTLVAGKQEGEWTFWHPNGAMESRGDYRADVRTGQWTHWYDNGQERMVGRYEQDRQEGMWLFRYPNGNAQCHGAYLRGREFGEWKFFYELRQDGLFLDDRGLRQQGFFLDGKRQLRWIARHPDGSPKSEGWYLDDARVGAWQSWDEAGKATAAEYPLPEGYRIVRETWDGGSVRREGFLRGGVPVGLWVTRHPGGGVRLLGAFADGKPTGNWQASRDTGDPFFSGGMTDGRPQGTWQLYIGVGLQKFEPGKRPQPPWDGEWSPAGDPPPLVSVVEDVLARWLGEITSPVTAPVVPAPAVVAPSVPPPEPPRLEAPTDPGQFTVREREELERYRRYYRDGFLPRQHSMGGEYGVAGGARRLGQGDRARADALVGKPLPVTRFRTSDGQLLDLATMRGKKVLLIVLRGFTTQVCVYCFAQTAELVPLSKRFAELNTEVVVVYPGSRSKLEAFLSVCKSEFTSGKAPYHMVYDPDLELSNALGVNGNLARPSALVLDQEGVIRAAYVAESELNIADRPPAKDLIALLEELSR